MERLNDNKLKIGVNDALTEVRLRRELAEAAKESRFDCYYDFSKCDIKIKNDSAILMNDRLRIVESLKGWDEFSVVECQFPSELISYFAGSKDLYIFLDVYERFLSILSKSVLRLKSNKLLDAISDIKSILSLQKELEKQYSRVTYNISASSLYIGEYNDIGVNVQLYYDVPPSIELNAVGITIACTPEDLRLLIKNGNLLEEIKKSLVRSLYETGCRGVLRNQFSEGFYALNEEDAQKHYDGLKRFIKKEFAKDCNSILGSVCVSHYKNRMYFKYDDTFIYRNLSDEFHTASTEEEVLQNIIRF